jgi:hypothetical protein
MKSHAVPASTCPCVLPCDCADLVVRFSCSDALAVSQDEDPFPLVRCACFCRCEQARRRRVAHAPKFSQDGFKAEGDVPCNVFEKDPFRSDLADDAGDMGPEVARIICAEALTSKAERLAWVSSEDGVDESSPRPSVEGSQVGPDRCGGEVSCPLGGNDAVSGVFFPLDPASGVEAWLCKHEPEIEAAGASTEGKPMSGPGMNAHVIASPI